MPVVLGCFWNGSVKPDDTLPNSDNYFKSIYTKGGNRIDFGDEGGKQFIKLINSSQNYLYFECDGPKITIHSEGDILLDCKKNNHNKAVADYTLKAKSIKMEADTFIEMKAGTNMKLEAGTETEIKAGTSLKESAGTNLEAKAGAAHKVSGMTVEVKGSTKVDISGSPVDIKGGPSVSVQAAIIRLN
jgi:hypothetical protein